MCGDLLSRPQCVLMSGGSPMTEVAIVLGLTVIGVLGWFVAERAGHRAVRRRFADRTEMSDAEFYGTYYARTEIPVPLVQDCRKRIGEASGVCWRLIRPEDRFDGVLAPQAGMEFDNPLDILLADVRERLASRRDANAHLRPQSVDDYIRAVAWLGQTRGSAESA